jgi:hypothetical protein
LRRLNHYSSKYQNQVHFNKKIENLTETDLIAFNKSIYKYDIMNKFYVIFKISYFNKIIKLFNEYEYAMNIARDKKELIDIKSFDQFPNKPLLTHKCINYKEDQYLGSPIINREIITNLNQLNDLISLEKVIYNGEELMHSIDLYIKYYTSLITECETIEKVIETYKVDFIKKNNNIYDYINKYYLTDLSKENLLLEDALKYFIIEKKSLKKKALPEVQQALSEAELFNHLIKDDVVEGALLNDFIAKENLLKLGIDYLEVHQKDIFDELLLKQVTGDKKLEHFLQFQKNQKKEIALKDVLLDDNLLKDFFLKKNLLIKDFFENALLKQQLNISNNPYILEIEEYLRIIKYKNVIIEHKSQYLDMLNIYKNRKSGLIHKCNYAHNLIKERYPSYLKYNIAASSKSCKFINKSIININKLLLESSINVTKLHILNKQIDFKVEAMVKQNNFNIPLEYYEVVNLQYMGCQQKKLETK